MCIVCSPWQAMSMTGHCVVVRFTAQSESCVSVGLHVSWRCGGGSSLITWEDMISSEVNESGSSLC